MKRIGALLATICGLYVAYSVYSIYDIVDGIRRSDTERTASHVDFMALRSSLKEQFTAGIMQQAAEQKNDLATGLVAMLGPTIVGNMIDSMITPSGLRTLLADQTKPTNATPTHIDLDHLRKHIYIASPIRLRFGQADGSGVIIAFRDWSWQIVDLRFPPDFFKNLAKENLGS